MTLRLIRYDEMLVTEYLCVCIYGLPDAGKSSLAFTASRPVLLDFDGLLEKVGNTLRHHSGGDAYKLDTWSDLEQLNLDWSKYDTVIIDTAGRAVEMLKKHVLGLEMQNRQTDGNPSLKGWGVIKRMFEAFLEDMRSKKKDVILLAHLAEEKSGDNLLDRLHIEGGSKTKIYEAAQAMGRIVIQGKDKTQKRYLDFSPRENALGKNPGRLGLIPYEDPLVAPHTLANVLKQIKEEMNKPAVSGQKSAAKPIVVPAIVPPPAAKPKLDAATVVTLQMQAKAQAEIAERTKSFLEHYNPKIEEIRKMQTWEKKSIHEQALALGLRFNPEKNFYEPNPDATNRTSTDRSNAGDAQATPDARNRKGNETAGLPGLAAAEPVGQMVTG